MAYEIERKFLVQDESWRSVAGKPTLIRQAYLARNGKASVRVRVKDNSAATIAVKSAGASLTRLEFEYSIPYADAAALLDLRQGAIIEKFRYVLPRDKMIWEIDVFQGKNEGLVIAEIELPHEGQQFKKPSWLGLEITSNPNYSNAGLANAPFLSWPAGTG